jgi:hypothetical protein
MRLRREALSILRDSSVSHRSTGRRTLGGATIRELEHGGHEGRNPLPGCRC